MAKAKAAAKTTTRRRAAPPQTEGFGPKLRQLRDMRGESVRQFARVVKMSPSYINKLELGHGQPTRATVEQIADACDYPSASLLLDAGYRPLASENLEDLLEDDEYLRVFKAGDTEVDRLLYLWRRLDPAERRAAVALVETVHKQGIQKPERTEQKPDYDAQKSGGALLGAKG